MPGKPDKDAPSEKLSDDLVADIALERTPRNAETSPSDGHHVFAVEDRDTGIRLDAFLSSQADGFSRNRLQDLIRNGSVALNGVIVATPKQRLKTGDRIALAVPPPDDPIPVGEDIPLAVVFEDDDLIVIDKPAGMVVHPAAGNWTGTLVNALIHHCGSSLSGIGGVKRPGIVHRLDKETSGLLIAAKNDFAHKGLAEQFADHGRSGPLRRAYQAVVWNSPARATGTIQTLIGRAANNRLKMAVTEKDGREAITHYRVTEAYGRDRNDGAALASLVTCHLETGRTHQIRVHMTHIGCPLIGDPVYGTGYATKAARLPDDAATFARRMNRQALHAFLLTIEHPRTGEALHFESPLPEDLQNLIVAMRACG